MSDQPLDHVAIEKLAIESFARVRGSAEVLGAHGEIGVNLEIVPERAAAYMFGVKLTMRLFIFEAGSMRDIKEQEVGIVTAGVDDAKLAAYLEGVALGIRARAEEGADFEVAMPHELFPDWALRDPERRTAADFAAAVLQPAPKREGGAFDDLSGTEPIAVNPEFEAAIAADPDKMENYVVYADWLTERGDPRGELITCSLPDAPANAKRRAADVLVQNERYFAGNLLANDKYEQFIQLEWALGWIASARVAADYDLYEEDTDFVIKALRTVLGLHSSKLIQRLTLGCFSFEGDNDYTELYPALTAAGARPSLRHLFIGDTDSEEQELSWTSAGDLKELAGLYPNLHELKIRAGSMTLAGALDYPKLRELILESGGISQESIRAVANASFPELRRLEIWTGSRNYGATSNIEDLAPILSGTSLPKLASLGLRNSEYTDDICRELATAPILERVTELDLSMGLMTDAGVESLLAGRQRFAHVKKLDVSKNYLTDAGIEALKGLGAHIELEARQQKTADDEWRYVSVGE